MSENVINHGGARQAPSAKWQEQAVDKHSLRGRFDWTDIVFFLALAAGAYYALTTWPDAMDIYEKYILGGTVFFIVWLGWLWRPLRTAMIGIGLTALLAIWLYDGNLEHANSKFLLKYLISSQSAVLWMCAMFFMATVVYWISYFVPHFAWMGTVFTWSGVVMGFVGLLVRWREGHLIAADMGHIPVSNLYEVFVLFCLITAVFYLYYEKRYNTRALGGFVLLVISSAVISSPPKNFSIKSSLVSTMDSNIYCLASSACSCMLSLISLTSKFCPLSESAPQMISFISIKLMIPSNWSSAPIGN